MEDGLVHNNLVLTAKPLSVLILIVVEDGLVLKAHKLPAWDERRRLNPCCSGRWSCTWSKNQTKIINNLVLILVVVEDGLVLDYLDTNRFRVSVLILIVVEDGLVLLSKARSMYA